ncbi:MAG TPA: hypothetical protein VMX13_10515 [Sedimentisphaerales bacterium]|nr:hypothetical protein [Sedimentisphaerales bacterium]
MSDSTKTGWFFGLLAGWVLSVFGRSPAKPGKADLQRADFKTSTQRLGVRFTERIRRVFRFKWLKVYNKTDTRYGCHSEQGEESHHVE